MSQFEYGIVVLSIGMTVVMVALVGLSLVLSLMKTVFYKDPKKKNAKMEQPLTNTVEKNSPVETKDIKKEKNNKEIIAAISAAIASYTGQEILDFNIISIRRVSRSEWQEAGKQELLQTKLSNQM
jgi:sodium pump decarboxylase gamma subunit